MNGNGTGRAVRGDGPRLLHRHPLNSDIADPIIPDNRWSVIGSHRQNLPLNTVAYADATACNTGWVAGTPLIVTELHDWLFPRQGTALPFLRCVSALDRDFVYSGEDVFSIANDLPAAP
jgi:hypothetical protein